MSVGLGWGDWWGPSGYAPLAFRTGYWNYYNPYCYEPLVLGSTVIDYTQPILISDTSVATETSAEDPATAAAMAQFDVARGEFQRGDYRSALQSTHRALESLPNDAALHEFLSLVHFAMGNYHDAAGVIHSVLAVGPGWSWETLNTLYGGDVPLYTQQLRAAEAYRKANPSAADVRFLLAYHYMTTGYGDSAAKQLREVMSLEPNDTVAAQLLEGLTGESVKAVADTPESATTRTAAKPAGSVPEPPPLPTTGQGDVPSVGTKPQAEALVGSWSATREDGGTFAFKLTADNHFDWTFTRNDQSTELTGKYTLNDDLLVLEPEEGGAMIGRVEMTGAKQFRFRLVGAPDNDPGLSFGQ